MSGKILVTGADGFIGSHLTETLVRRGYVVKAFAFYNSFNSWGWLDHCADDVRGHFEVFTGDIRDPFGVTQAMKDCDSVLHLASLISIPYSYVSPSTYIETNVQGTLNILQAARDLNVRKVVHTSTSEVYGTAKFVPINEDHPLQGQSPYSASKIAADQLASAYYSSFNLPVVTVRPFNTFGPRQSARAVIPTIITQIASGEKELKLGAIKPTRDFSFVEDTVSGFLSVFESNTSFGEVFNLGSGFEISIEAVAHLIADSMGKKVRIASDSERFRPVNSEVERLLADNSKIGNLLGWKPTYVGPDGLRIGLNKTIDWFSKSENLRLYKSGIYNL